MNMVGNPKDRRSWTKCKAAVDGEGKLIAWDFQDYGQPWTASGSTPLLASLQVGLSPTNPGGSNGTQSSGEFYAVSNQLILAHHINWHFPEPIPLRTSNLRAPGDVARCFASEGFLDEIAADLKVDPVEFRLNHLTANKRAAECLKAAADKAGWQKRPSPAPAARHGNIAKGRGVALTHRSNTYVAIVADVEVNKTTGQVAVKKLFCAHDCGLMVNPDGVMNQVEGNVIQGVSRAMYEEVMFDSQRRRHQPRLGDLSDPAFPGPAGTGGRLDQPPRDAAPRRRRRRDDSASSGNRQRDL